jgi:hypothetical protein
MIAPKRCGLVLAGLLVLGGAGLCGARLFA